ncbi:MULTISPECIES: L-valine transporter subunit YgaH [unclassified Brenneria]|uniref:L-valine transporter subunit YgaH n=1 Tax=unclassified Brenneria TaxID=2634434 RepID=UPI001552286A|nr:MULTISPECIES: L-valine transporter subunit YgaH [unclassified Brenneria]MBJ7223827.1 L-valine transporter subunit YgaH [Brenneria sp. L3-3C-1]MEE3645072.1 L-valine transporter subunit YgaH [Brenneria sp. L3_3C_1]MEE3652870.1 L-valine transporter subunit YgaH [Brenneria sp. HEZEL_4_2_4]NPD02824.1 L-valine transporter subunit YgaH [Brenneria sp. hezel4-2-4]
MSTQIILIGLIVGLVNYLFRYLPLKLGSSRASGSLQRGKTALLLDSIGIASICALLIVSSVPDILKHHEKLLPTLVGFIVLTGCFYKTRSIVFSTLLGAFCYGLAIKFF